MEVGCLLMDVGRKLVALAAVHWHIACARLSLFSHLREGSLHERGDHGTRF
jgi:hypothetical protein